LTVGLVVRRGDRTWRLERHLEDNTLVFADQLTARPMTLTVAQLWRELQSGALVLVTGDPPAPTDGGRPALTFTLDSLQPKHREEFERRMHIILLVRRAGLTRGRRQEIDELLRKHATSGATEGEVPSTSSVMDWMRRVDEADGSWAAVVPKSAFRKSPRRLTDEVLAVARTWIRNHYCTRKRPSLMETHLLAQRELDNQARTGAIAANDAHISLSTLRRLKREIDPYSLDVARYGKACARNRWRYSLRGTNVLRAMQRYEVDHAIIDVVVICDRTGLPQGRPTITVVVDAHSSYVVGFFVSFWGTGLASTLKALKVAIAPKDDYVKGAGLQQQWLGMGIPELLVVDNGLEFHSPQFAQVAFQLGVDLEYCAVRQPWLKPRVERALGAYLNLLPSAGRVRKPVSNEVPLKPDKTAAITFSALCHGLLKTFVEAHALQINERKLARPYDLFAESLEELPPPVLAVPSAELDIIVAPSRDLTIGNEGAVTNYLRFNSRELQQLRRSVAPSFKTTVKFDPEDLGRAYVQDPTSKGWLLVPNCRPDYADGLSLLQHKAIRAHAKKELNQRNADEVLARARLELIDLWAHHEVKGKRLQAQHVKALAGLTSTHVLARGATAAPPAERLLTEPEVAPTPVEIPDFDAFVA
jgi:putative transposase